VIMGRLIPAGTGLSAYQALSPQIVSPVLGGGTDVSTFDDRY